MSDIDWIEIETQYRVGVVSVNALAKEHGISEGAIRKRAKKLGWLRDPEGVKRQIVKASLAGGTNSGAEIGTKVRTTIEAEANQDIADLNAGLDVARAVMRRLPDIAQKASEPRDLKVIAEANRIAVDTIMKIRGLEDGPKPGRSVEDILKDILIKTGELQS